MNLTDTPSIGTTGDCIHRFTFENLPIRGQWVRLSETILQANAIRKYPQAIRIFLNEMFAAVSMFADNLKFEGAVALQSRGDGPLIRTLAECRERQFLRGIAHLNEEMAMPRDASDLSQWLGNGQLALSLIPPAGHQQSPYQGIVSLQHASLSDNLQTYLLNSEQLPSRLYLASAKNSVTGLLLQRLPSADLASEVSIDEAENAWQSIITLADTVSTPELLKLAPEVLLHRLFNEHSCRLYPARPLSYKCSCTRQKSDRTLRILGRAEIQSLHDEQGEISVDCEFCGTSYVYDAVDIGELLNNDINQPAPDTRH